MYKQVLVVAGADTREWPDLTDYLREETYWVGVDRGALYLVERQLPLDLALGDFDSISKEEQFLVKQKAKRMMFAQPEKDFTDTEWGVVEGLKLAPEIPVIMIGVTGGRMDHLLANIWLPFHMNLQNETNRLHIRDKQNSIRYYLPGVHGIKKEIDKKYLAFICLTPIKNLTLKNVKYPLNNYKVTVPTSFASNEFTTNEASFSFDTGVMMVIQSKDN